MGPAPSDDSPALHAIERLLATGEGAAATAALLPLLDRRAGLGDPVCRLAARALRRHGADATAAPDAMATALDRLVTLLREQEAQIGALRAMVEQQL